MSNPFISADGDSLEVVAVADEVAEILLVVQADAGGQLGVDHLALRVVRLVLHRHALLVQLEALALALTSHRLGLFAGNAHVQLTIELK